MNEPSDRDALLAELEKERSIRRTVKLLHAKRSRIIEDLDRLISHLSLLIPLPDKSLEASQPKSDILIEAAKRIKDPIFTDLLIKIIQEKSNR